MDRYKILAADDKRSERDATRYCLERLGLEVDTAETPERAIEIFRENPDTYALVILDYDFKHPSITGADLTQHLKKINPNVAVIIYSAVEERDAMKKCWDAGANDFIDKGADTVTEELKSIVLAQCRKFRQTFDPFQYEVSLPDNTKKIAEVGMVGVSAALVDVADKITRYKERSETVIIYGNTGTGKELVSRALHGTSNKPFHVINCAAFKDANLLESELFGHERGAFTGADKLKQGILEVARDGTVFFDEIHQLSPQGQAKLLRVFQEKKIRRMGSADELNIQCRFIVASKPDLKELVDSGQFLEDFYYRINKLSISIPDLKDRPEDIEPLISYFVDQLNKKDGTKKCLRVSVVKKMKSYSWPGNIRELENTIVQLLTNSSGKFIELDQLDPKFFDSTLTVSTFKELEEKHSEEKKDLVLQTLARHRFKSDAAKELGLVPSSLAVLERTMNIYQPKKRDLL